MPVFLILWSSSLTIFVTANSGNDLFFLETFETDPFKSGKWLKSEDPKYKNQPVVIRSAAKPAVGFENDNGLLLSQEMKYYGLATKFPKPYTFKGSDNGIVIQYELKLEEQLKCGGAYVKLPRYTEDLNLKELNNETPYIIMFGPDKCGPESKVHFILQHQHPTTKVWEEKHFNTTIPVRNDQLTHLYTLHISRDNNFAIYIDMKVQQKGNLLTHMIPPINPSETIDDPTDTKPLDWVDIEQIPDPTAKKPDDWDEDAPPKLVDEKAVKPAGWADDAPLVIPDPAAVKPEDWDDEEVPPVLISFLRHCSIFV